MNVEANPPAGAEAGPGYEVRDTNVRAVVTFLIGLTLFILVVQVSLWGMLRALSSGEEAPPASTPAAVPTGEAAEAMPPITPRDMLADQLRALRRREDTELGLVPDTPPASGRLTIEQAIDAVAERGLPAVGTGRTAAEMNSHSGKPAPTQAPAPAQAPDPGPGRPPADPGRGDAP